MKRLFYLLFLLISINSFGQISTPSGFTRFYSNIAYDGLWPIKVGAVPVKDTMIAVKGLGQMVQDSATSTVYHVVSLTGKKWEPMGGGAGSGVTSVSVSMPASTALSVSPTTITSAGTFAFTYGGTSSQYIKGNGALSTLSTDVQTIGDARYMQLGATFPYTRITNFQTGVLASVSAGSGINISSGGVISATGSFLQDGLVSGGVVTWSGTGLVFDVTPAVYIIGGVEYTSPQESITLNAADPSFGRYDVVAVDITGHITKVTGVAGASPVIPQVDPADQIYLTAVFIDAGATTPTQISNSQIYDENVEWTTTSSGSVTVNYNSTVYAQSGSKSALAVWSGPANLIFTNGATLVSSNYTTLSYYVRLINTMPNNTNISVQFYNGTNPVSNQVTSTLSKSTTGSFQLVSFNMSQFTFTSTQFNSVRLILTGSTSGVGVAIDNIKLQAGVIPPTTGTGLQSAYTKFTDGTNIATSSGSDVIKLRSVDNKLSIVVANNDATHGDNALFTINQGNLSLSSIGGSLNVSQINATGTPSSSTVLYGDGTWGSPGGSAPGLQSVLTTSSAVSTNNTITGSSGNAFNIEMGTSGSLYGFLKTQGGATTIGSQYSALRYANINIVAGNGLGSNQISMSVLNLTDAGGAVSQINMSDDGKISITGFLNLNSQYTPSSSSDTSKPAGTITTDNDYLYYRAPGDGLWRRIAWTTF